MAHPAPDPVAAGQESVWDYPRPPRIEPVARRVTIELGGERIVDTSDVVRVLETSHPPVYYVPDRGVRRGRADSGARVILLRIQGIRPLFRRRRRGNRRAGRGWNYPTPSRGYELLTDRVAVYAGRMDRCTVDGEEVVPQPGGFYGGWITSDIVGPFKGEPGTRGW